jgi:GNAT superfamily N-acetyltransferase
MQPADVPAAAQSLARAFHDDPHFSWIIRDEAKRLERLEKGFALFIRRIWLPHNFSYTHEQLIGAALWMPPETWHLGIWPQLRLMPGTIRILRDDSARLLRALTFIERKHPRSPAHWYLPMIGVTPAWQGRGFGAALLQPVLERCDRERTPAYLEASTPRNRALYERHGFEVMEECRYAPDGPPIWRMWREPHA